MDDIFIEVVENKPSERDAEGDVQNKPSGEQSESEETDGGEEGEENEGGEETDCAEKDVEPKDGELMSFFPEIANHRDMPMYTPEHVTIHNITQEAICGHANKRHAGHNEQSGRDKDEHKSMDIGEEQLDEQNKGEVDEEKDDLMDEKVGVEGERRGEHSKKSNVEEEVDEQDKGEVDKQKQELVDDQVGVEGEQQPPRLDEEPAALSKPSKRRPKRALKRKKSRKTLYVAHPEVKESKYTKEESEVFAYLMKRPPKSDT